MTQTKRYIFIGIGVLVLLSLYFFFNPSDFHGYYPECLFHKHTGYHCPGCGSQRAIHDLTHLNFIGAISHNPLMVFTFLFGGFLFVFKRDTFTKIIYHYRSPYNIFGLILVYWILRNIPFAPFTYLAP